MKKTFAVVLGVLLICGFSAKLVASETPADPKFDSVEWYKCEVGRVKYQQGLEEKESKLQCLKNDKVSTGNIKMALIPEIKGGTTVYYYPVTSKENLQHYLDKSYSFQCAPSKGNISNTGLAAYGISNGSFDIYMISPPEMSQYEGRNWVDNEYAKKGLVVNQAASVGAFSYEGCGETMCQFYSKETNMRFGLFKIACGSKASTNVSSDSGSSEGKGLKGLKGLFKKK